jgi:opacity protein-like surface antigen
MKYLLLACAFSSGVQLQAQPMNYKGGPGGTLSFGQRATISTFNHGDEKPAPGVGGNFRIRLSERVNTEWFFDYLPATNQFTRRADYHIGWSVLLYPFKTGNELFVPYVLAGHCFDYTHHTDLSNSANQIERWSSAVQAGIGTHINLTERFDISVAAQYMIHLGTDVHAHIDNGAVEFEQHKGGSLEGHVLLTVGLNYKFTDLWARD